MVFPEEFTHKCSPKKMRLYITMIKYLSMIKYFYIFLVISVENSGPHAQSMTQPTNFCNSQSPPDPECPWIVQCNRDGNVIKIKDKIHCLCLVFTGNPCSSWWVTVESYDLYKCIYSYIYIFFTLFSLPQKWKVYCPLSWALKSSSQICCCCLQEENILVLVYLLVRTL